MPFCRCASQRKHVSQNVRETQFSRCDEFLVILPKHDKVKCQSFLETYLKECQTLGIHENAAYGFAVRTTGMQSEDEIIAAADGEMYSQKKSSREGRA